jgi:anti-anti-sigma regulatory factor
MQPTPTSPALRCFAHTEAGATFSVQVTRREDLAHLVVIGDLGESHVAVLEAHLHELVAHGVRRLLVDVSRARQADRAASHALAGLRDVLRAADVSLSVTGARGRPRALRLMRRRAARRSS